MIELLFVLVFLGVLFFTGVTLVSIFAAGAVAFAVMLVFGMMGMIFKLLPWLIVLAIAWWFFRNKVYCPR